MSTTASAAARIKSLSVIYPGDIAALQEVDLEFRRGHTTALIGANGSGKSTLLKVLAGRLRPSAGIAEILPGSPPGAVGYASQEPALDPEMTGAETFALFAALHRIPRGRRASRIAASIGRFGLGEHHRRPVAGYSGGLRRRLHLALVWLAAPQLLLLDEPTAGLDPQGRELIWELIAAQVADGGTVVVASHDLGQVQRHCAQAVILHRGRRAASGSPAELARRHASPRIRLRLAEAPNDAVRLRTRLQAIDGVREVHVGGAEVWLEVASGAQLQPRLVESVSACGLEIAAIGFPRADLAGAYQRLTGRQLGAAGEAS